MRKIYLFLALAVSLTAFGCNQPTVNTNANVNTSINTNANANMSNANANMTNSDANMTSVIDTKEPNEYTAKVTMNFEAVGDTQTAKLPTLTANVARDGDARRMEFAAPNGQKIVYIDTAGKNSLVLPDRKQYANINQQSVGFDVRRLMMPENIVDRVQNLKGLKKVGEEKLNGRDAVKYEYESMTDTQTKAGDVATQSFIYIDKETGLPLRSITAMESKGGQVQGFKGLRVITEMSEIKTEAGDDLFTVPGDYAEVEEQQIKQQVDLVFNAAMQVLQQVLKSAQTASQ